MNMTRRLIGAAAWATRLAIGATAVVAAGPAVAGDFFMSAAAGGAGAQLDCAAGGVCDKSSGVGRLAAGYAFTSLWGIEIVGSGTGRLTGGLDRGAGLEPGSAELGLGALVGTATWRPGRFSLTAKAGIATIESRARYADYPTVDHRSRSAAVGLELGYALSTRWTVILGNDVYPHVEFTGITNKPVSVTAVGVRYDWK